MAKIGYAQPKKVYFPNPPEFSTRQREVSGRLLQAKVPDLDWR